MSKRVVLSAAGVAVVGLFLARASSVCAALGPEQVALIVNSKVPASRELAEFYAQRRNIPAERIIAVDLPYPAEEIPFDDYDTRVAPALRKQLRDKGLRDTVTCLVTFYGVPLRIARRVNTPEQQRELTVVQQEMQKAQADLEAAVVEAEAMARELTGTFQPGAGREVTKLADRAGNALTRVLQAVAQMPRGDRRDAQYRRLTRLVEQVSGEGGLIERFTQPGLSELAPEPITPQRAAEVRKRTEEAKRRFEAAEKMPPGPQPFREMRDAVRENFGLFRYVALLQAQFAAYETDQTESAFDSEVALLWWEKNYPRYRWQLNALNFKVRSVPAGTPPTLMVTRLDGPTPEAVDRVILSSLKAEKEGLKGQVVLDGRGIKADDGYGKYDQSIRSLAEMLKAKGPLKVTFDDANPLIQPGPDAPRDVALYCGWYSLRNYVPAFQFNEGAVGFHVASSELVSLRCENERGWVRGLLNDGVAATLGPVAEPYLHAFPPADEFFPLLLTGKLTLAEVYWKTTPLTSWMTTCVGDPLYTPYKANPVLKMEELPDRLWPAFLDAPVPSRPVAPAAPAASGAPAAPGGTASPTPQR